jgi:hypothetical protein
MSENYKLIQNGLDSRGLITSRGKIFLLCTESSPGLGPTQPPIQLVSEALSPAMKQLGHVADPLTSI